VDFRIQQCSESDFFEILSTIEEFWGNDRTRAHHHPILIHEFGNTAFVVRGEGKIRGYLFGFFSQTEPAAYVHLVAIEPESRRQGLARRLYDHFIAAARRRGCTKLKALTEPTNKSSIAFHTSMGMKMLGEPNAEGIAIVRNYSGPGEDRIVFVKDITGP
jgi:GNAT superfamily N-acetyltransferase